MLDREAAAGAASVGHVSKPYRASAAGGILCTIAERLLQSCGDFLGYGRCVLSIARLVLLTQ
jgi:hypothetical protein